MRIAKNQAFKEFGAAWYYLERLNWKKQYTQFAFIPRIQFPTIKTNTMPTSTIIAKGIYITYANSIPLVQKKPLNHKLRGFLYVIKRN